MTDLVAALAIAYVVLLALLALVAWDEAPATVVEADRSRGLLDPDAY